MAFEHLTYAEKQYLRIYGIACGSLAATVASVRIIMLAAAGDWFRWLVVLICVAGPTFLITGVRTLILRRRLSQLGIYTNQKVYGDADFVRASEARNHAGSRNVFD